MHIPSVNHNIINKLEINISLNVYVAWKIYKSNSVPCSESSDNIFCSTAFLHGKSWHNTHHASDNTTQDLSCLVVTYAVVSPPFKTK